MRLAAEGETAGNCGRSVLGRESAARVGVGTYYRTLRYLKPQQIFGRIRFKLARPAVDLRPAPGLRARSPVWMAPASREPSMLGPTRFRFLNVERDLDRCGWDDRTVDRLWRYNLHYFDDLNARAATRRSKDHRLLLDLWIQQNPPGRGTGWEPYPCSLRIVNWIKWFLGGSKPEPAWLQSLAVQARWVHRRLETHLLGNHLFVNAKALIFAGLFFEGTEAEQWLRCGQQLMDRQLPEQVLADGAQFELSPMYHALALEDVLDLVNIGSSYPDVASQESLAVELRGRAASMLYWLRCMCHPDGRIGAFNDSADGIAPSLEELERYAAQLAIEAPQSPRDAVNYLRASGYIRVSHGRALALLDVARIGPDYLPAHGHADTLSFELSLGARRVVVNGGTSCYGTSARRLAERGTAAHSTVQLEGRDSSEVWSGFRVGRRARVSVPEIDGWRICCSHDGYRFLPGRPRHRRCWCFDGAALVVDDAVSMPSVAGVARYILAPGLRLRRVHAGSWRVLEGEAEIACIEILRGRASHADGHHAPQFGVSLAVECLVVQLVEGRATTRWNWQP